MDKRGPTALQLVQAVCAVGKFKTIDPENETATGSFLKKRIGIVDTQCTHHIKQM